MIEAILGIVGVLLGLVVYLAYRVGRLEGCVKRVNGELGEVRERLERLEVLVRSLFRRNGG